MRERILVVNAGSSSIKFSVFETMADRSVSAGAHGQVEGIGTAPHLEVTDPQGKKLADEPVTGDGHAGAIAASMIGSRMSAARPALMAWATGLSMAGRLIRSRC
jgi:acetate kinase